MAVNIADMEDAVIETLRGALPYLRTCESLGEFMVGDLDGVVKLAPAVYVAYGGGEVHQLMNGVDDHIVELAVIIVTRNARGEIAARHGKAGEKGAYGIIVDVWQALSGNSCGGDMDPLALKEVSPLYGEQDLAIYAMRFSTRVRMRR